MMVIFLQPVCYKENKENEEDKPPVTPVFSEMTDPRDGRVYKTVRLGIMTWFAENLADLPQVDPPHFSSPDYTAIDHSVKSWLS